MEKVRRIFILILTVVLLNTSVYASVVYEIRTPEYTFTLDGQVLSDFPVYDINGDNYIPVNFMAGFFGFHLEVDGNRPKVVNLLAGSDGREEEIYGNMSVFVKNTQRSVSQSEYELYYNENPLSVELINIDGYNFISLEHAAEMFGVAVHTNEDMGTVNISTNNDPVMSEEELAKYRNYLAQNAVAIDTHSDGGQEVFEGAGLEKYRIYLAGENHGIAANFEFQLYIVRYLYENQGVRNIIIESGYSDAELLNVYMQTGDSGILKNIMANYKGTFSYSKDMEKFYKNLYEYNKTLPEDAKLRLIGIDVQHQIGTGVDYLLYLIPETKDVPDDVLADIRALENAKKESSYNLETFQLINVSLTANKEAYIKYLGEDYPRFKKALDNIIQNYECVREGEYEYLLAREKEIIENFISQYEELDNGKFFGMLGVFHTHLNGQLDGEGTAFNLATYLNSRYAETKGQIASFTVKYYECNYMDKETGKSEKLPSSFIEEMMAETAKSDFTLFTLDKDGSIFVRDGSTGSQQYLILIKNSPAAQIYKK